MNILEKDPFVILEKLPIHKKYLHIFSVANFFTKKYHKSILIVKPHI